MVHADTIKRIASYLHVSLDEVSISDNASLLTSSDPGGPQKVWNVPQPPSVLVGRKEALKEIQQQLGVGKLVHETKLECPIIVIQGLPGVGKTALTATLVHQPELHERFPDGILWATLGTTPDLLAIVRLWSYLINMKDIEESVTIEESVVKLAIRLRGRRVLLVLDDVWHADHIAVFQQVVSAGCGVLVTTRENALAQALDPAKSVIFHLSVLTDDAAQELLHGFAPAIVERHREECLSLVHALGGLPLALQLAGHVLRMEDRIGWDVTQALNELHEGTMLLRAKAPLDCLDLRTQTIPSVSEILKKSTDRLDAATRKYFAELGDYAIRSDTLELTKMAALWKVPDGKSIVRTLMHRGLLEAIGSGRFRMHPLIAVYAKSLYISD